MMDDEVTNNQRSVYTLIDALSNTGGFISIFYSAVGFLISQIQASIFFLSIISKLFLYEYDENEPEYKRKKAVKIAPLATIRKDTNDVELETEECRIETD